MRPLAIVGLGLCLTNCGDPNVPEAWIPRELAKLEGHPVELAGVLQQSRDGHDIACGTYRAKGRADAGEKPFATVDGRLVAASDPRAAACLRNVTPRIALS
jgi:hypothetical protein